MEIKVENHTNTTAVTNSLLDDMFWVFAASQWQRLYDKFVPKREGWMADAVVITPKEIHHIMPYAAYQYYGARRDGSRPIVNRNKGLNNLAASRWDDAAIPTEKPKLEKSLEEYLKRKSVEG